MLAVEALVAAARGTQGGACISREAACGVAAADLLPAHSGDGDEGAAGVRVLPAGLPLPLRRLAARPAAMGLVLESLLMQARTPTLISISSSIGAMKCSCWAVGGWDRSWIPLLPLS